jgi:hypothetical protein
VELGDSAMIHIDAKRGWCAAEVLRQAFGKTGVHGRKDMAEDVLPGGSRVTVFEILDSRVDELVVHGKRRGADDTEKHHLASGFFGFGEFLGIEGDG